MMSFNSLVTSALCIAQILVANTNAQCTESDGVTACDTCLDSSLFTAGTYRITASGTYCLTEDIEFDPTPGTTSEPNDEDAWFPTDGTAFPSSDTQSGGAFVLGFFAVISIEADDVKIDLNGYTLSMGRSFYLQQRWGSIIEIANQAFLPSTGPAEFGSDFVEVDNIEICNGVLGRSSHHGIHSNNATNINIHDLTIEDFEVAAIQLNGFNGATLQDLVIGPSSTQVSFTNLYSNGRFVLLALRHLIDDIASATEVMGYPETLSFNGVEKTIQDIESDLVSTMDIAFRIATGTDTAADAESEFYQTAIDLFISDHELPDGSAVYGIILNSFSVAVNGFGASLNEGARMGQDVLMRNIAIFDLKLVVDPVPAMYLDRCDGDYTSNTQLQGPFGDILDARKMIDPSLLHYLTDYDRRRKVSCFDDVTYVGNPLSNAQIAIYSALEYGSTNTFGSFMHPKFVEWALTPDAPFPSDCARFVCNGDIMFHSNKGIVGIRVDGIEGVILEDVTIAGLENESPLASSACENYVGFHDGGNAGFVDDENAMDTDVRGISIVYSDVFVKGTNSITNGVSLYGDAVGVDLMSDSELEFDVGSSLKMTNFMAAAKLTQERYEQLIDEGKTPDPNNFFLCSLSLNDGTSVVSGDATAAASWMADDCKPVRSLDAKKFVGPTGLEVCYCQNPDGRGECDENLEVTEIRAVYRGCVTIDIILQNRYGSTICETQNVTPGEEFVCNVADSASLSELPSEFEIDLIGDCKATFMSSTLAIDSVGDRACREKLRISGIETSTKGCDDGFVPCTCPTLFVFDKQC